MSSCTAAPRQEGDDTDYAAALGQAMSYLNPNTTYGPQSPGGAIKVILMMTDGAVDVHRDTQQYGTDWLAGRADRDRIQQLAAAKRTASRCGRWVGPTSARA